MKVIGHQLVLNQLTRVIEAGTLSHAYILVGPAAVGKKTVAEWAASQLLKIDQSKLTIHPDLKIVQRAYDEKKERFKRDLGVEEVREAIQFATESSFQGGYKVIIITEADRLNTEAGNALLKILEEPPAKTIFFLLYQTMGAIMPTIKSRAQILNLGPVDTSDLLIAANEFSLEKNNLEEMVTLANGRPGLLLSWLENPDVFTEYKNTQAEFINLLGIPLSEKFVQAENWLAESKDSGGTEELINRLITWQAALVPYKVLHSQNTKIALSSLTSIHTELSAAILALRQNSHPRLTLEVLLAKLP